MSNQISEMQTAIGNLEPGNNPNSLKTQLRGLDTNLKGLSQSIKTLSSNTSGIQTAVDTIKQSVLKKDLSYRDLLSGSAICLGIATSVGLFSLKGDSNYLVTHLNQTIWKLQAIEKQIRGQ